MIPLKRIHFAEAAVFVLLFYLQIALLEAVISKKESCPIGFKVAYDVKNNTVCYRIKGPETFVDKFENCAGNLFSPDLLQRFILPPFSETIWTDYKNIYDGGPFVDWSYTKGAGDLLDTTYEVNRDSMYNVNEELCVVIDPVLNFTAVRCNEKHYWYCFVDPYKEPDKMKVNKDNKGCHSLNNIVDLADIIDISSDSEMLQFSTFMFWSPLRTCLLKVKLMSRSKVRMTWNQSKEACKKRGGSLLNRGWRYSNYPFFSNNKDISSNVIFPLGVRLSMNLTLLRYDADHDSALIPQSDWHFTHRPISNDTRLGAVLNDEWELVNDSYTFFDVICEKTVPLRHVNLTVFIDNYSDDKDNIVLMVDDEGLQRKKIHCFTDSAGYSPKRVNVMKRMGKPGFILKFINDGYYWCTHIDTTNFYISESNKILHIKVKDDTENLYAVKLTSLARDYDFKNIGAMVQDDWKIKIEEYVFYSTKYKKTYGIGAEDSYDNHTIWKFRNDRPGLEVKDAHVVLKRVYLNSRSALLHVRLHPSMLPVAPGQWDDISIDSMKPAYFCKIDDHLSEWRILALGETKQVFPCKIYKCTGDFNEGVQLVMTWEEKCLPPKPQNLGSTVSVTDVTDMPTGLVTSTTDTDSDSEEYTTRPQKLSLELNSSDSSEEDKKMKANVESTHPTAETTSVATQIWERKNAEEVPVGTFVTEVVTSTYSTIAGNSQEMTDQSTTGNTISSVNVTETDGPFSYRPPRPPTTSPAPVITALPTYPPTTTPPPIPPEQEFDLVMEDLNTLLNNTEPILVTDINNSFDQLDGFLADNEELEIPGNLLHILDDLGARLSLNGSNDASTVRRNIALLVADALPTSPVRGLKIAARQTDSFTPEAFQIIRHNINDSHLMSDMNEVVIHLPESIAVTNRRISFVVFRNDRAFQRSHYSVNSKVLSINIENTTEFHNGEVIDIYLTPINEVPERNQSRSCAFWKFLDDGSGRGYWSEDGCTFIPSTTDGMLDTCRCTHLTHFAEVLIPRTVFSERSENALEIISIVGCIMSIIGLILVGVTALLFRSWRRDYSNKIWLQLCISIFIMSLSFLVIIFAHFEEYAVTCMLTGIVLHFSVLSSFCWMLVAAVLSYRRLVTVFTIDASHKLLRASAFAWGVPCAVVGILLSVAPHSYSGRFDDKNPTTAFCYPSGLALWLSVFAPLALMLVVNWTLFALIVRSVFASRRNHPNRVGSRHSADKHEALRCASVSFFLVFLFGLPWLLGLFAMNEVMAYFFVLLSTFQGFVLFLFFVLGNKKTRDLWLNKLKIKQTRKIPVTSSTYTNNRSTAGNANSRSANQPETIETMISKPRSLVSLDDSRFS